MFKLSLANIAQIKSAAKHFGEIWFHGDGNIYDKKSESDHRQKYSNGRDGVQTYRVKFIASGPFPETAEELSKLLLNAKTQEAVNASLPASQKSVSTFKTETVATAAAVNTAAVNTAGNNTKTDYSKLSKKQLVAEIAKPERALNIEALKGLNESELIKALEDSDLILSGNA